MTSPARRFFSRVCAVALAAGLAAPAHSSASIPVDAFTRHSDYQVAQISPDGEHIAVTLRKDGEEVFAVLRRDTKEAISAIRATGLRESIGRVFWVNDERLVYTTKRAVGWHEQPRETGSIYAVNADGSQHEIIAGYNATTAAETGTRVKRGRKVSAYFAVIDRLKSDPKHILAIAYRWGTYFYDPETPPDIYRVNVYNGSLKKVDPMGMLSTFFNEPL